MEEWGRKPPFFLLTLPSPCDYMSGWFRNPRKRTNQIGIDILDRDGSIPAGPPVMASNGAMACGPD